MAVTSLRDSESHLGIFISADNFPTMFGSYGAERLWLMATGTFSSKRGLPAFVGADGNAPQTVRGSIALGTTPQRVFGHVISGQANGEGLAFCVEQGTISVMTEGNIGLLSRRPQRITLETADWLLTVEDVNELRGSDVLTKAEREFLRHVNPPLVGATGHHTESAGRSIPSAVSVSVAAVPELASSASPSSEPLGEKGSLRVSTTRSHALPNIDPVHVAALEALETGEDTLATIAELDVQTWPYVLEHPSCYPELRLWVTTSLADFSREASSPDTPSHRLAELAYEFPQLRSEIIENPGCYRELRDWIFASSVDDVQYNATVQDRGANGLNTGRVVR